MKKSHMLKHTSLLCKRTTFFFYLLPIKSFLFDVLTFKTTFYYHFIKQLDIKMIIK
jgi:hypothetical protein